MIKRLTQNNQNFYVESVRDSEHTWDEFFGSVVTEKINRLVGYSQTREAIAHAVGVRIEIIEAYLSAIGVEKTKQEQCIEYIERGVDVLTISKALGMGLWDVSQEIQKIKKKKGVNNGSERVGTQSK